MKIKDYSIIETEWIDEIEKELDNYSSATQNIWDEGKNAGKLFMIELIKSKLKPLVPIVENALDEGMLIQRTINDKVKIPHCRIKDYINNTIIE